MFQKYCEIFHCCVWHRTSLIMGAKYIMEAIETTKPSGDHFIMVSCRVGIRTERNENYDSAIDVYEQILASVKSQDMRVSVSEHLARVCLYSDRFDRAESCFVTYLRNARVHSVSRIQNQNLRLEILQ